MRTDIQALRGLAVLLVVFQHAKQHWLPAGYLGVDIFFVISGYLITRLVKGQIETGRFNFFEFYARRAKRLLPAAYVTFVLTTIAATFLLTTTEFRDFFYQLVGSISLTGNIVLWSQTGYFEGAAELKPLLHVWSLALEEQYYLLLPVSLFFVPRRHWTLGTFLLLATSLCLCLGMAAIKPSAVFYLLPTRAWELAIGSVGAVAFDDKQDFPIVLKQCMHYCALLILLAIPLFPTGQRHPGLNAILVCLATLVVLVVKYKPNSNNSTIQALGFFGNISYSLYLVHWPLFAFLNNVWAVEAPMSARFALIPISIVLGFVLFHYVEKPIRESNIALDIRSAVVTLFGSVLLILFASGLLSYRSSGPNYTFDRRINVGMGITCDSHRFKPTSACRTSDTPSMLVWGDSFAMHLMSGIIKTSDGYGVAQATRSTCPPLFGLAGIDDIAPASISCSEFNQSVIDYLLKTDSITVVVLSSQFHYVLANPKIKEIGVGNGSTVDLVIDRMKATVALIRNAGKRAVVVAPPPSSRGSFDIGRCHERRAIGMLDFGATPNCMISVPEYRKLNADVLQLLRRLPGEAGVNVVSFDNFLCDDQFCKTQLDGKFLYRDSGHLSYDGSDLLAERMGLVSLILEHSN